MELVIHTDQPDNILEAMIQIDHGHHTIRINRKAVVTQTIDHTDHHRAVNNKEAVIQIVHDHRTIQINRKAAGIQIIDHTDQVKVAAAAAAETVIDRKDHLANIQVRYVMI